MLATLGLGLLRERSRFKSFMQLPVGGGLKQSVQFWSVRWLEGHIVSSKGRTEHWEGLELREARPDDVTFFESRWTWRWTQGQKEWDIVEWSGVEEWTVSHWHTHTGEVYRAFLSGGHQPNIRSDPVNVAAVAAATSFPSQHSVVSGPVRISEPPRVAFWRSAPPTGGSLLVRHLVVTRQIATLAPRSWRWKHFLVWRNSRHVKHAGAPPVGEGMNYTNTCFFSPSFIVTSFLYVAVNCHCKRCNPSMKIKSKIFIET